MMISEAVRRAEEGLDLGCARVIARNVRFHGTNGIIGMELFLQSDSDDEFLLSVALYAGRGPYYRPWIEMFCINNLLKTGEHYFDSSIEDEVL